MGCRVRMATAFACVGAFFALAAAPALGTDPVVEEWPVWPYEAACYGPPFDPVSVFSGSANAELGSTPGEVALNEAIHDPALADVGMARTGWRLVSESETQAVFVTGALSGLFPWWALFKKEAAGWKWAGSGSCTPHTVLHGLEASSWGISADQRRLTADTRRIRIVLTGGGCSSGMSANPRARKPIFRKISKRRLLMTVLLEPLPPGAYTCQGVMNPPMEVTLPGPLGQRRLYDGGTYPPGDVVARWREVTQPTASRSARLSQ